MLPGKPLLGAWAPGCPGLVRPIRALSEVPAQGLCQGLGLFLTLNHGQGKAEPRLERATLF